MKKFLALLNARNKEFYRDRGTLGWTLVFPFIVLAGFTYGYSGRQDPVLKILATSPAALEKPFARALAETPGLEIRAAEDEAAALKKLERYQTDLVFSDTAYWMIPDSDKGRLAAKLLLAAAPAQEARTATGRRIRYSDWVLPGLLAMNIMFGSMFGVGYVIVRYRKNGVLKRLRATPLSAFQFLVAQIASRMLIMIVTSFMVIGGAMLLIGFRPQGSLLDLALFLAVSSTAMIAVGMLVAARIGSEEIAEGVLNLMTWPMIFLSGVWFSLEGASQWVLFGAKLMPLTHVVDGLRAILIDGVSITQLGPQIAILLALSAAFVAIGSLIFRWR